MSLMQFGGGHNLFIPASDPDASNLIIATTGAIEHGYTNVASLINTSGSSFSKFVPRSSNKPQFSTTNKFYSTSLELGTRFGGAAGWFAYENPSVPAFGSNDFCLETWVYIPTFTGLTQCTLWSHTDGTTNSGFQCFITGDSFGDTAARRGIYFVGGAGAELNYAGACLSPNTWHHVAVVRNGSASNSLKIYVDGVDETDFRNATGNPNWTYTGSLFVIAPYSETGWNNVKIQDYRIYQGAAKYTSGFTPPTEMFPNVSGSVATDPNFSDVEVLLHMDGTNGSTTFTDSGPATNTITVSGNAAISTTQSKFGGASGDFSSGGYLYDTTGTYDLTGSAWTVEGWAYYTSSPSIHHIFGTLGTSQTGSTAMFHASGILYWQRVGTSTNQLTYTWTPSLNQWYHLAVSWDGTTLRMFIDGTVVASNTVQPAHGSLGLNVGGRSDGYSFPGYLDDVRITSNVARYTANFTPPTAAFPNSGPTDPNFSNVELLLFGDGSQGGAAVDSSSFNQSFSISSATVDTVTKKYGTGSLNFAGTQFLTTTGITLGTDVFTYEFWVYWASTPTSEVNLFDSRTYSTSTSGTPGSNGFDIRKYSTADGDVLAIGTNSQFFTGTTAVAGGQWYHIAVVRDSSANLTLYLDGTQELTTNQGTLNYSSAGPTLGRTARVATTRYSGNAYMDDIRLTKGVARYTSNFTPPTAAFPNS